MQRASHDSYLMSGRIMFRDYSMHNYYTFRKNFILHNAICANLCNGVTGTSKHHILMQDHDKYHPPIYLYSKPTLSWFKKVHILKNKLTIPSSPSPRDAKLSFPLCKQLLRHKHLTLWRQTHTILHPTGWLEAQGNQNPPWLQGA